MSNEAVYLVLVILKTLKNLSMCHLMAFDHVNTMVVVILAYCPKMAFILTSKILIYVPFFRLNQSHNINPKP